MKLHPRRDVVRKGEIVRHATDICSSGRCSEDTGVILKEGATPANSDFDAGLCDPHWEKFCESPSSKHRGPEAQGDLSFVEMEEVDTAAEWEEKERRKYEEAEAKRADEATTISLSGTAFGALDPSRSGPAWEKIQKGKGTTYRVTLPRHKAIEFLRWAQGQSEIWLVRNAERELKKMGVRDDPDSD